MEYPNGKGLPWVDFYGYTVLSDGSVLNKRGNKPLKLLPGQKYVLYIDGKPVTIRKKELLKNIFDKDFGKVIEYPDGRGKDKVNFYGYTIYRDGTVITPTGYESFADTHVIKLNEGKVSVKTRVMIYACFSGKVPERDEIVVCKKGDDYSFDNLVLEKRHRRSRALKLSYEQCDEICKEYSKPKKTSLRSLAEKYGVSCMTIQHVVKGEYPKGN